ncbi:MAG TPA: ABC transporter ATP-binding protein/permease [Ramlibacter sp.]|nr:ABC transporter ATP-binding protein/permease [Ramlibacter sp.]
MTTTEKFAVAQSTARKVWALTTPYFSSEEKWKARLLLTAIIALNLGSVYMAVLFNDWYKLFYDALQVKNETVFWEQLIRFTYIAFGAIIVAVYKFYLTQLLELRWRSWMTKHYLKRWLTGTAFYRMELARFSAETKTPDNPDQRIQEDLNLFTSYSVSLTMGLLNAVVTLVTFVGILWSLSGGFTFTVGGETYELHGAMVWAAIVYCVAGSVITHFIGRPQIGLNFQQQRLEADFRHHMVRVREYSEAIALDRGQSVEREHLDTRFLAVLGNYLRLIRARKNLIWFNSFFAQAALIYPFIVAAPRYFSGTIQLGVLMQIVDVFGRVQDSLAWFVDNYSTLAIWRATTDRLTSFEESVRAETRDSELQVEPADAGLAVHDLSLALPTGAVLASGLNLAVAPGDTVLLTGPSGSGKSTLFRAFAGIWPFARGKVEAPAEMMAIPQNPYFPDGSLRAALAYPEPAATYDDDTLKRALEDALLPELASRLDVEDAWSQKLSGGERQRLALARVFLKQPRWVLADEATSALDAAAEATLYQRLLAMVKRKGGALVSIAHRPSIEGLHHRRWELAPRPEDGGARWQLQQTSAPA